MGELSYKAKFEVMWAELARLNIKEIEIEFEGADGHGQVHRPQIVDEERDMKRFAETDVCLNGDLVNLLDMIGQLAEDTLYVLPVRWWSGDGGYGCMTLHVDNDPPFIEIGVSERIVSTRDLCFTYDRHGDKEV